MKIFSKKGIAIISFITTLTAPIIAFAQDGLSVNLVPGAVSSVASSGGPKNLSYLVGLIMYYMSQALVLIMGAAIVLFVFYVVKYFMRPSDGAERAEAGKYVMYSIIGFFIIASFWGLIAVLKNTFNLDNNVSSWSQLQSIFPR